MSGSSFGLTCLVQDRNSDYAFKNIISNEFERNTHPVLCSAETMNGTLLLFSDQSLYLWKGRLCGLEGKVKINVLLNESEMITKLSCGCDLAFFLTSQGRVFKMIANAITFENVKLDKFVVDICTCADSVICYTSDNEIWTLGANGYGELGSNRNMPPHPVKREIDFLKEEKIKLMESGYATFWVWTDKNRLLVCGRNEYCPQPIYEVEYAQLEFGDFVDLTHLFPSDEEIVKMASGSYHGMFLTNKNNIYRYSLRTHGKTILSKVDPPESNLFFTDITTKYYDCIVECSNGDVYMTSADCILNKDTQRIKSCKIIPKRWFNGGWSTQNHSNFSVNFKKKVETIMNCFYFIKQNKKELRVPPKPIIFLILTHFSKLDNIMIF
eukprot:TRINITY_DN2498_c0_g1_i1.p1 TRINITY_DN2498_c0_g1~~TRINITY_DN2498_c0_g1_i1.p1  ORF type:complete len:382 (+),score=70.15 TRINITY_DN2498_c0_g1_i1:63-1208(+)